MIQSGNGVSSDDPWGGAAKQQQFARPTGSFVGVPLTGETEVHSEEIGPSTQSRKMRPTPTPSEDARQRQLAERDVRMTINDLYRGKSPESFLLQTVSESLDNIFDQFTNAMGARKADDLLVADNALIHIRQTLPELFYLSRDVGDGFGECMRAIHYALNNKIEEVPSLTQLQELRLIVRKLKHQPFVNIDQAVEWLMALEDADLEIDSPVVGMIAEAVDENVSGEHEESVP